MLSIIIPTRNRALLLHDALQTLPAACHGLESSVECLVIDNGSTDNTRAIVEAFAVTVLFPVHYIHEPCPGLHVGRNLGATLARGEILAYLDDDVLVQSGWAAAILRRFQMSDAVALVGGPCRPAWEEPIPAWVEFFKQEILSGWYYAGFSVIDLGEEPRRVPCDCVFGCNFSIRKSVLLEAGGFHPDGMPAPLLRYRGDGEDAVAKYVAEQGFTIYYEPCAAIRHRVPQKRLSRKYILDVGRRSGISIGYTQYRTAQAHGFFSLLRRAFTHAVFLVRSWRQYNKMVAEVDDMSTSVFALCRMTAQRACAVHFLHVFVSPRLAHWVTQPTYFKNDPCPYWQE